MAKSPDAFRTISEVADWLGIQAHVLRFWESKFSQVKPVKRAGGRRYYRPNDMLLLGGIRQLLHEDGLTIKGVQKILREEGVAHVAALSQPLDELTQEELADEATEAPMAPMAEPAAQETGTVVNFERPTEDPDEVIEAEAVEVVAPQQDPPPEPETATEAEPAAAPEPEAQAAPVAEPETAAEPEPIPDPIVEAAAAPGAEAPPEVAAPEAPADPASEPMAETTPAAAPAPSAEAAAPDPAPAPDTSEEPDAAAPDRDQEPPAEDTGAELPAFLRRPMGTPEEATAPAEPEPQEAAPAPEPAPEPPAPKPRVIDMPVLTPLDQIPAQPGILTTALQTQALSLEQARQIAPLLDKLTILRDSMVHRRPPGPGN